MPGEAHAPLIVDANAVLAFALAPQSLQHVASAKLSSVRPNFEDGPRTASLNQVAMPEFLLNIEQAYLICLRDRLQRLS